jgi:hypothetical protein
MRKDQLIRALLRSANSNGSNGSKAKKSSPAKAQKVANGRPRVPNAPKASASRPNGTVKGTSNGASAGASREAPKKRRLEEKIRLVHAERERLKDLSSALAYGRPNGDADGNARKANGAPRRDRVVLMVRDPYWLHVCWEICRPSVERVRAAMSEFWHTAKPVLRLLEVDGGATTSTAERVVREIEVHGGVNNWYLNVTDPPKHYRVDLGYSAANGRFFSLSRSNAVTTPRPGGSEAFDQNWTDVARNFEKVYALSGGYSEEVCSGELKEMFEERLRRSMNSPFGKFGGADGDRRADFTLDVDTELIVYGRTRPDAHVTLAGQPVTLRDDGSFAVRRNMPERRQVLPLVAGSRDGLEQRTIILAIDRNTKVLEPVTRDGIV